MTQLDLGALVGRVALDTRQFDTVYVRVVQRMSDLGAKATVASEGTDKLDASLTDTAAAGSAAATGLGRASQALTEAGISASRAAAGTTEAALASSRLTQATLRQQAATQRIIDVETTASATARRLAAAEAELEALQSKEGVSADKVAAAQERVNALRAQSVATTGRLAAAQATLIAANDRVALSQDRVAEAGMFGARSADSLRRGWESIPGPVKVGAAALAVGAFEALKAASNYQTLVRNLQTGAGESQRNLKMVGDGMLRMAGQVGFSATDLAKAMFYVESAGFHGAAGLRLLDTAAKGAKVDFVDLPTMVDALTSAMNAYHEPASNAARVTNTLIASAAVGKMHLQDLAASLGTVLPSAAALRVPLDQVGAALATMTTQGTDAQRAATYLRFAFAALANPTSKAQKAMQAVGLTSEQVATEMTHGGITGVFQLLQDAVGSKFPAGSAKYLAALANMVGGTRGLQAVLELTGKNFDTMNANLTSIDGRVHAAGNSVSDWADVQKNLNQQWSEFIDGLGAAGIKVGEDLIPAVTDLLRVLNGTGHAIGDVTGFFKDNETAADALAVVLTMSLEPALSRVAIAAGSAMKALAVGRLGAAGSALKGLGVAGLAGKVGVAAVAIEALNAAQDLRHLNDNVKAAQATLHGFSFSTQSTASDVSRYYGAALKEINAQIDDFDNKLTSFSAGDFFHRALHPVSTVIGALNFDSVNNQLDQAQYAAIRASGAIERVTEAMGQIPYNENMDEMAKTMAAAGITANDLSRSTGYLVDKVRGYIASNKQAQTPSSQAAQALRDLGSGAQSAAQDVQSLTAALDLFAGDAISADQGAIAFRNDIAALDKALKHSHGSLSLNTQAGRDARDAFDSAAQQALNTAEAESKLKDGADKARATLQAEIQTLKDHAGGSDYAKAAIDRLTTALNHLPSKPQGQKQGQSFGSGYALGIRESKREVRAAASGLALTAAGAAKLAQQSHSPSKVAFGLGREWGTGYAGGINSTAGLISAAAARSVRAAAAKAKQVQSSVASSLLGETGIGAVLGGDGVDSLGAPMAGATSTAGIITGLLGQRAALRRMRRQLRRENRHGLSDRVEETIAALGLGQGSQVAGILATATPHQLRQISELQHQIGMAGHGIGQDIAGGMFGRGIDRMVEKQQGANGLLKQIDAKLAHVHDLNHELRSVAREIRQMTIITDTKRQDIKQGHSVTRQSR